MRYYILHGDIYIFFGAKIKDKTYRTVAVHPHACGEHRGCFSLHISQSPRLWGTHKICRTVVFMHLMISVAYRFIQ